MANKKVRDAYGGVEAWNELFEYVKLQILGYDTNMTLPRQFILRLEGLSKGNFIASKHIEPMANYQYQDILLAFKLAKVLMKDKCDFKDDEHKFNYAMVLVESKINDIVKAKKSKEILEERIKDIDVGVHTNEKAEYKASSIDLSKNDVLNSLW